MMNSSHDEASASNTSESTRPHILVLMTDQHSPRIAGCYGDPFVRTPTLDRLAEQGAVFDGCYCDNPLCVPSRMSMLTGRHGHQIGVWSNHDSLDSTMPTVAHGMAIAGYKTVLAGRMHFIGEDQYHGFEQREVGDVTHSYPHMNRAEHRFRGFYSTEESIQNPGEGNSFDLVYDTTVAMSACRAIRDHEVSGDPRPLFLVASFYSPHDPYVMPAAQLAPYLETSDSPIDAEPESPHAFTAHKRRAAAFDQVTSDARRRARAAYRAKTEFVDRLMGEVVTYWNECGMGGDDDVKVYLSDHGEMLGEHGLWAKGSFYDASARVPLILAAPRRVQAGQRISHPVSLIDLIPTLLDAAGAPPLPLADGVSFWPALTTGAGHWPEAVFSEQAAVGAGGPCRMVRRGKWKYNHYAQCAPELFDLEADPHEMNNLADVPAYASVRESLHELVFRDGWDATDVRRRVEARGPDEAYLRQFARAREPRDPWQWGLPAPL